MSKLYENLAKLCEKKGISAYRMCKDVGIQPSIMTDLKMGRRQGMSADTANRVANYFQVSTDFLLTGDEKNPFQELEGVEFALYGEVKELTDAQKRDVLQFVQYLKQKKDNS